jgi:putative nucleotidyltransferase with HDIG domain
MTHQELLRFFHANYPTLVSDMRNTDHAWDKDNLNPYHLEGTIFEHTMLVFHEAVRRGYDFEIQLACLLHDIGKPYAMKRNEEKQKVTFYNHESESVFRSLQIMEDLKLPQATRERLVKVIGLHTEVFKQPLQSLYELINDEHTYYSLMRLATCDHSGRFADIQDKIDYELFLPKEIEQKSDVQKTKKVTLMVGLPYSGKSTEVDSLLPREYPWDHFIVSRDKIIGTYPGNNYNEKWSNAIQKDVDKQLQHDSNAAKEFSNVIVDMTHMSLKSRRKTLSHFGKDWQKDCIVLLPTLAEIERRKSSRPDKVIDNSVLDAMMSSFRPPCSGEGFDNITYKF